MNRTSLALAATLAMMACAQAQTYEDSGNTIVQGFVPLVGCTAGGNCAGPVSNSNPLPVSGGSSGTPTQSAISVGTSSVTILAANTATTFIKLCIASTAANGIWVNWTGAAAVQAAPSELIQPGQCDSWTKASGFLPTSRIQGIASATVPATLIYN